MQEQVKQESKEQRRKKSLQALVTNIKALVKPIKIKAEKHTRVLREHINDLICEQSKDTRDIERTLDILLDYATLGVGYKEFFKLNMYYWQVDKKAANDYFRFYRKINK